MGGATQLSTPELPFYAQGALVYIVTDLMLPNPYHQPATVLQFTVYHRVPMSIPEDFLLPERRIILRPHKVLRAAMPEAPVYK